MTIIEKIDNLEAAVFEYETSNITSNTISIYTEVVEEKLINTDKNNDITRLNNAMSASINAINNKDYLLLADLFEYELKPMITRK